MSIFNVGDSDELYPNWVLRERRGRLELWENVDNGYCGVYLYEHERMEEYWLLHAVRGSIEAAREIIDTVENIII